MNEINPRRVLESIRDEAQKGVEEQSQKVRLGLNEKEFVKPDKTDIKILFHLNRILGLTEGALMMCDTLENENSS